uniref:Ankyrin repeat-containing protein n=1 Tax=Tanacetum cinerariifolium TaxID=118510 RepID=A0A6L2JF25_TANCI|nr:ankyrin repeat-containing protein [Tanacetum cinerariifolium]
MTKITDLEASFEQYKAEQEAIHTKTKEHSSRLEEKMDKNKAEAHQQFAEIMRVLQTLQPATATVTNTIVTPSYYSATTIPPSYPTQPLPVYATTMPPPYNITPPPYHTLPATIPSFEEKSGESYTSSKVVKDSRSISDDVTKVADSLREQGEDDWQPPYEPDSQDIQDTLDCCNLKTHMDVTQEVLGKSLCDYGELIRYVKSYQEKEKLEHSMILINEQKLINLPLSVIIPIFNTAERKMNFSG